MPAATEWQVESAGVPAVRLYHQAPQWSATFSVAPVPVMLPAVSVGLMDAVTFMRPVAAVETHSSPVRPLLVMAQPLPVGATVSSSDAVSAHQNRVLAGEVGAVMTTK